MGWDFDFITAFSFEGICGSFLINGGFSAFLVCFLLGFVFCFAIFFDRVFSTWYQLQNRVLIFQGLVYP